MPAALTLRQNSQCSATGFVHAKCYCASSAIRAWQAAFYFPVDDPEYVRTDRMGASVSLDHACRQPSSSPLCARTRPEYCLPMSATAGTREIRIIYVRVDWNAMRGNGKIASVPSSPCERALNDAQLLQGRCSLRAAGRTSGERHGLREGDRVVAPRKPARNSFCSASGYRANHVSSTRRTSAIAGSCDRSSSS